MITPRIKGLFLAALGTVAIAVLSGCDANENADLENGRALFTENCAFCHSLREANSVGAVKGPDLDAAFAAARNAGMDQDTFEGVVEAQIESPRATDESDPAYMPANLVEGDDLEDVAAYVASVAGVPGIQPPQAAGGEGGQIFTDNGCASCHTLAVAESTGTQGPNLDEVLPGQDEAMVRESIIAPSAEIEQGFSDIMPQTYEDSIEPKDLDTLIKFLIDNAGKTDPAAGGAGAK